MKWKISSKFLCSDKVIQIAKTVCYTKQNAQNKTRGGKTLVCTQDMHERYAQEGASKDLINIDCNQLSKLKCTSSFNDTKL